MITRAQAEALLTLAESLEACAALDIHLRADPDGAMEQVLVQYGASRLICTDWLDGMTVRLAVDALVSERKDGVIADTITLSCAAWGSDMRVVIPRKDS